MGMYVFHRSRQQRRRMEGNHEGTKRKQVSMIDEMPEKEKWKTGTAPPIRKASNYVNPRYLRRS
jgi:hypothetical protein